MIQTLGPPPSDTLLDVKDSSVDISRNNPWTLWLNLLHQILENVGSRWTKVADVTFPACPGNSSVDVNVTFDIGTPQSPQVLQPATLSGEMAPVVVLGLSANTGFTVDNGFFAWVSAPGVITIREFCVDAGGIGPFTDTFTITVLTGAPNVQ